MSVNTGASPHAVYLFQDDESNIRQVALKLQHFCCDGTSMINLFHRLLLASLTEPVNKENLPPVGPWTVDSSGVALEAMWKESTLQLVSGFAKAIWNPAYAFHPFGRPVVALPSRHPVAWNLTELSRTNKTVGFCQQLSEKETLALLEACKRRGTSVTGALMAAALQSASRCVSRARIEQSVPNDFTMTGCFVASTRKVGNVNDEVLSHFASGSFVRVNKCEAESFWATAQTVKTKIANVQDNMLYVALMGYFGMSLMPLFTPEPTVCISSWSPKSPLLDTYGPWTLVDGELLQNTRHVVYPIMSTYTVKGRLHLSLFGLVPRFEPETLQDFLSGTVQCLRQVVKEEEMVASKL